MDSVDNQMVCRGGGREGGGGFLVVCWAHCPA